MKANKKVLGAAAALTMSLAMAAGSTFAWFTTGNTATVSQFELGVTSGNQALLISAGNYASFKTDYSSTLGTDVILNGNGYYRDADGNLYHAETDVSQFFTEETVEVGTTDVSNFYTYSAPNYTKCADGAKAETGITYYSFKATRATITSGKLTAAPEETTSYVAYSEGGEINDTTKGYYWTPVKLDAVTTTNGTTFTGKNVSEGKYTVAPGCYITLVLNFRVSEQGYNVYLLDNGSSYKSSVEVGAGPSKAITYTGTDKAADVYGRALTVNNTLATRAAYASRLSFTENVAEDSTATTYLWAPYDNVYGNPQGNDAPAGYENNSESYYKSNLAADYEIAFADAEGAWPATASTVKPASDSMNKVVFATSDTAETSGATEICHLTNVSGEGSITIRIWIEGDDGDCFNSILEDTLKVQMAFTAFKAA